MRFHVESGHALAIVSVVLLFSSASAQAAAAPPQCSGFPGPLQPEVGDPPSPVGTCSDPDGGSLTITITQPPQKGTVAVISTPFTPFPLVQYSATEVGADSFKFKASDGSADSDEVTVTTDNLPALNDPPQCFGPFSEPLQVEVGNSPSAAGSCFDEEGQSLTFTITQQPQKGVAAVVTQGIPPFTAVQYRATSVGPDSFKFKASDGTSDSSEVTVTTENRAAIAEPPQCGGFTQIQLEVGAPGSGVPCSDAEGDNLTITITQEPQKGDLEVVDQGAQAPSLTYTATSVGPDSFSYKANDGTSDSNEATTTTVNVDTQAPQTTIDASPAADTSDATPTFEFSSNESRSTFACSVDGSAFTLCSSPKTIGPLAVGPHSFRVQAVDGVGHVDTSPAGRDFTVTAPVSTPVLSPVASQGSPADTVAPAVSLGGGATRKVGKSISLVVTATTEDLLATLSGTVSVPGASRIYKLTGVKNRFVARGSKVTLNVKVPKKGLAAVKLALRKHRNVSAKLRLTVRDAAGNVAVKTRTIRLKL